MPDFDIIKRPDWTRHIYEIYRPCAQRILIVTDGLNYLAGDGFGLTEMIAAITDGNFVPRIPAIIKAHRRGGSNGADINSFRFDTATTAVTRANYDQLWLIGIAGGTTQNGNGANGYNPENALNDNEIGVIAAFMEAGGGVFATGDHGTLGFALNGLLPRIRHMREWQNTPMGLEALPTALRRIDTVVDPGSDGRYQFDDQSDEIPQRIYPHYRQNASGTWVVHPLLASGAGDISVLPDHPHESECFGLSAATGDFPTKGAMAAFAEFPSGASSTPLPEVVASSMAGGRQIARTVNGITRFKPPVTPRSFGAISAYNGDAVVKGRIVCQATWHHLVNINLNGVGSPAFGAGFDSSYARNGLRDAAGNPTPAYLQIKRYFGNILRWLSPLGRRNCGWFSDLVVARFSYPLFEEIPQLIPWPPKPDPPPIDPFARLALGEATFEALAANLGEGGATEMLAGLLDQDGGGALLNSVVASAHRRESGALGLDSLHLAALGGVMEQIVRALPGDPNDDACPRALKKLTSADAHDELIATGLRVGLQGAGEVLRKQLESTRETLEQVSALSQRGATKPPKPGKSTK